jgi:phosphoserine aminotransferase
MTGIRKPPIKPACPHFSSGPCAKPPGWSPEWLAGALLGRSHRSRDGRAALSDLIGSLKRLLELPSDYRLAIVPGSDTGAFEMAMWSLIGARGIDVFAWDVFGCLWVRDLIDELKIQDAVVHETAFGQLPDMSLADFGRDVVFTANGTTSGVRVPDFDWIRQDREGLTFCDATSAVFAQEIDWSKLDVVTFSWQKCLGGEAAHGVLILSPRAVERALTYTPAWPVPKLFRFARAGVFDEALFEGQTINTPSMLCIEDCRRAIAWAEAAGGLSALQARVRRNAKIVWDWIAASEWAADPVADPATRSLTSIVITIADPEFVRLEEDAQRSFIAAMAARLAAEGVAFDIAGHRGAPPGLRIWTGATIEAADLIAVLPWLDWAYGTVRSEGTFTGRGEP